MKNLLEIKNLTIVYSKLLTEGVNPFIQFVKDSYDNYSLIKDVNLTVRKGEYLGLVGESGSGKSLTVKSILGLLDVSPGIVDGEIFYQSNDQDEIISILAVPDQGKQTFFDRIFHSTYIHTWHCKIENNRITLPKDFIYKNGNSILRIYKTNADNFVEIVLKDVHFKENNKILMLDEFKDNEYAFLIGLRQINRTAKSNQKSIHKSLKENKIPGRQISIILQDPISFLNPFWSLGRQMKNLTKLHADQAEEDIIENLLSEVKLNTDSFKNAIPRELSGGQGQRAMILLSSITKPTLLIADEPTTGLDVTLKKIIVEKFHDLRKKRDCSMIFISHDLGMVKRATDRINVMYKGEIIENCISEKFDNIEGHHPYVSKLLGITQSDYVSNPDDPQNGSLRNERGCSYFNHCTLDSKNERCRMVAPPAISVSSNCILFDENPDTPWVKCWDYLNG